MGKALDHCVTLVSSKPNNKGAWSSGGSRLYAHTLPDTMVKGAPIPFPLRKEFYKIKSC
jgi:hypothetical protein